MLDGGGVNSKNNDDSDDDDDNIIIMFLFLLLLLIIRTIIMIGPVANGGRCPPAKHSRPPPTPARKISISVQFNVFISILGFESFNPLPKKL